MWQKISENAFLRAVFLGEMSMKSKHWTFGILMGSILLYMFVASFVKWLTL